MSFTAVNYFCMTVVCVTCLIAMLVIGLTIKASESILKTIPPNKRAEVEEKQVGARFYLLLPFLGLIYLIFFGRPDAVPTTIAVAAIAGGVILYRTNYYDYARKVSVGSLQANRPDESAKEVKPAAHETPAADPSADEKSG